MMPIAADALLDGFQIVNIVFAQAASSLTTSQRGKGRNPSLLAHRFGRRANDTKHVYIGKGDIPME
jgi:hypothetical protein